MSDTFFNKSTRDFHQAKGLPIASRLVLVEYPGIYDTIIKSSRPNAHITAQ